METGESNGLGGTAIGGEALGAGVAAPRQALSHPLRTIRSMETGELNGLGGTAAAGALEAGSAPAPPEPLSHPLRTIQAMETLPLGAPGGNAAAGSPVAVVPGGVGGPAVAGSGELVPGVVFVGASDALGRVTALVDTLVAELAGLSLAGAGRDVLRSLVGALGRVRAGADAAEARAVTALERLGDGGVDAVEVLRRNAGSSQREAQRRKRRAEALAKMPNVAGALAAGDISAEHAEALARAAAATSHEAVDGDADLLAQVAGVPADRAGRQIQAWTQRKQDPADLHEQHLRQRRRRRLNFGDGDDGMLMAHAAFDRVLGAQFRSLINGIADRIWRAEGGRDNPDSRSAEQRRLDALAIAVGLDPEPTAAARESAAGGTGAAPAGDEFPPGTQEPSRAGRTAHRRGRNRRTAHRRDPGVFRSRPSASSRPQPTVPRHQPVPPRHQIVIVASADVVSGKNPQGRCEIPGVGPIPQSELERLACDAELFGVLFSGDGDPLWHGRGERTATDAQRRALLVRDGVCVLCADEPARCESHHIIPWAKPGEGPTDIDNLAFLCGTCHRRLHNHKRVLTRSPDGAWGTTPDPRHARRRKHPGPHHTGAQQHPSPRDPGERNNAGSGARARSSGAGASVGPTRTRHQQKRAGTPGDGAGAISPDAPPTATGGPTRADHGPRRQRHTTGAGVSKALPGPSTETRVLETRPAVGQPMTRPQQATPGQYGEPPTGRPAGGLVTY